MQLILIEGTHGTGKSMLGKALAKKLESIGKVVSLYDEYDRSNPVDTWAINMMRKSLFEQRAYLSGENVFLQHLHDPTVDTSGQWMMLSEQLIEAPEQVVIFVGKFWQNCVMPWFFHDIPVAHILAHHQKLCESVMAAKPLLVFLSCSDTTEGHKPLVDRGELLSPMLLSLYGSSFWSRKHAPEGTVQDKGRLYLQAWQAVLNQLYQDIPFSRLEYPDAWKHWSDDDEYQEKILSEITGLTIE
ncbi:hypothetical protein [Endozoicomonas atrinae]|uniref:hypothetical protein n=1 Tax=Endozoicomonas atrinae TaxID=1333660 RepID=UPI003AFFCB03